MSPSELPAEILFAHIGGGLVGIICGFTALFAKKGARVHRAAGAVFAVAMVVAGLSAAYLGYLTDDPNDISGGVLTAYMVVTAWVAARRKDKESGLFEVLAFLFAMIGAALSYFVSGQAEFKGAANIFVGVVAFAALLDLSVVIRGGLRGRQRIARHLWRMCMGLFVAAGSFFLGQMQVFPEPLRKIEILSAPVIIIIALMFFWLLRVVLTNWWREK